MEMEYQDEKILFCRYRLQRAGTVSARSAMTLLEMVVAMSIMVIVFVVVLPQLSLIRNNWDSREGIAETIQNGRVLTDHLSRNLSKAVKITAVSNSTDTTGYIEFLDNDDNTLRYDIAANNYIEFGQVGSQSDLAGQVSSLQFTCYDGNDFSSTTTDGNSIRFVKAEATVTNPASLGQDKTFTTWAYLRTNAGSLIGWWKLDETSGLLARDSSGRENHGTLYNMTGSEWTAGIIGGALEFDGNTDYVDCGNDGSLQITGTEISLAAWVKWDSADDYSTIAMKTSSGSWTDGYGLYAHSDNTINFYVTQWNVNVASKSFTADGQWHHVVGTYDGSDVRVWVDGVEGTPDSYTGNITNANHSFEIGRGYSDSYNFDGTLDDVRIYNRALSAAEIASLANILKYQSFTEAKAGTDTTSITVSTPADTNESDLLIAAVATDGDTSASLVPPGGEGWTEIDVGAYSTEVTLGAWWKLAGASESASHQFSWSGGQQVYGWMMRFTGHDAADPIDVSATYGESSSTPTSPSVTTTVSNSIILRLGAFDQADITVDDPGLSGHTAITMDRSGGGLVSFEAFAEDKNKGTSVTISTPAGTSETDLLIAAVATDGDTSSSLAPPGGEGWTEIDVGAYGSEVTLGVWWKPADASESPTHQFSWSSKEHSYGWMMRFTNHNQSSPINASASQGTGNNSSPPSPAVTTSVADTLILRLGAFDDDDITKDSPGLSGHTAITMDDSGNGSQTTSGGAGYVQQAAIGDSGTSAFALTASEQSRTVTIAIASDPAGGETVSGGAGYIRQSSAGASGTSAFTLTDAEQSRTVTIGITPDPSSASEQIYP